jgi:hypothetical protein
MKAKNSKQCVRESQIETRPARVNLNGTMYVPETTQEVAVKRGPGRPAKNAAPTSQPTQQHRKKKLEYETDETKSMKNLIGQLFSRVAELVKEIKWLKNQAPVTIQNSQTQRSSLVNIVAKEQRERENKAKNVVIRGIKLPDVTNLSTDQVATAVTETVNKFVARVTADSAKNVNVREVNRIPQSKLANETNTSPLSYSAVVVLESEEQQRALLNVARRHNINEFDGVFAHEDRTKAQQMQYREHKTEAREKNAELLREGKLDKPFRYVVRAGGVRCIDVGQSKESKKSIYCSPQRPNKNDINQRFANVNNRRGTISKSVHRANLSGEAKGEHTSSEIAITNLCTS